MNNKNKNNGPKSPVESAKISGGNVMAAADRIPQIVL